MDEQKILFLQDYILSLSKSMYNNNYVYWFEEFETDLNNPQQIMIEYYKENSNEQGDVFFTTLSSYLTKIEVVDDWSEYVYELCLNYGLSNDIAKILEYLVLIFSEELVSTWVVKNTYNTNFKNNDENDNTAEIDSNLSNEDTWCDILFKVKSRVFIFHFGKK